MVVRPAAQRPVVLALGLLDRQIVDAGNAHTHQSLAIELPVLIAVRAEVLAAVIAPFIGEAHCDPMVRESPDFLDQAVVQLPGPFTSQERDDLLAALDKLGAIAPTAVLRVSEGHCLWIA